MATDEEEDQDGPLRGKLSEKDNALDIFDVEQGEHGRRDQKRKGRKAKKIDKVGQIISLKYSQEFNDKDS